MRGPTAAVAGQDGVNSHILVIMFDKDKFL